MKYYVQYYTASAIDKTKLVEVCGNNGVKTLDARMNLSNMIQDARKNDRYIHFEIRKSIRMYSEYYPMYNTFENLAKRYI